MPAPASARREAAREALTEALAAVVAQCRADWKREMETLAAEARAAAAELRETQAVLQAHLMQQLACRPLDQERTILYAKFRDLTSTLMEKVDTAVSAIPAIRDGRDGSDGMPGADGIGIETAFVDGDGHLILELTDGGSIDAGLVRGRDGQDGEPGADGKDGRDGKDGEPGAPGMDGRDGQDGEPGANGKDGRDGKDGEPGSDGQDGEPGAPGAPGADGKDGVGIGGLVIDRQGHLILTLTDGRTHDAGPVVGRDGEPGPAGRDGADGLGFDDIDLDWDGERAALVRFSRAERVKEIRMTFPVPLYRGAWRKGDSYERGDMVTFGGQVWCAARVTDAKPAEGADWTCAVKKGRDGRAGRDGEPGPAGPAGPPGEDLTHLKLSKT